MCLYKQKNVEEMGRKVTEILLIQVLSVTQPDKASWFISDQQNDKHTMSHGVSHLGSDQLNISTGAEVLW